MINKTNIKIKKRPNYLDQCSDFRAVFDRLIVLKITQSKCYSLN